MNRKVIFRAWMKNKQAGMLYNVVPIDDKSVIWLLSLNMNGGYSQDEFTAIMQYSGLNLKDGAEIYDSDLLRINIVHGGYPDYKFDGIYEVVITEYSGVRLRFIKLAYEDKDSVNQYPIHINIEAKDLFPRWAKVEGICVNIMDNGKEIKSINIERVGNIYENPELIKDK